MVVMTSIRPDARRLVGLIFKAELTDRMYILGGFFCGIY
jgi:hypothetical protein